MPTNRDSPKGDEQQQGTRHLAQRNALDANAEPSADAPTEAIVPSNGQPAGEALATIPDSSIIDAVLVPASREPKNHRELAEAIFAECDPVKIGRELLESGDDKNASVRARVFETLTNWQFGKKPEAAAAPARPRPRIIWTIPGPPREGGPPEDPPPEDNE